MSGISIGMATPEVSSVPSGFAGAGGGVGAAAELAHAEPRGPMRDIYLNPELRRLLQVKTLNDLLALSFEDAHLKKSIQGKALVGPDQLLTADSYKHLEVLRQSDEPLRDGSVPSSLKDCWIDETGKLIFLAPEEDKAVYGGVLQRLFPDLEEYFQSIYYPRSPARDADSDKELEVQLSVNRAGMSLLFYPSDKSEKTKAADPAQFVKESEARRVLPGYCFVPLDCHGLLTACSYTKPYAHALVARTGGAPVEKTGFRYFWADGLINLPLVVAVERALTSLISSVDGPLPESKITEAILRETSHDDRYCIFLVKASIPVCESLAMRFIEAIRDNIGVESLDGDNRFTFSFRKIEAAKTHLGYTVGCGASTAVASSS